MKYKTFAILACLCTPAFAAVSPDQICLSKDLTRQGQDLCRSQIASADTMAELKQVQKKFRDRIKAAEDARKTKK